MYFRAIIINQRGTCVTRSNHSSLTIAVLLPFNRGGRHVFFTGNNVTYRVACDTRANQHWKDMKFKSKLSVKRANAAAELCVPLWPPLSPIYPSLDVRQLFLCIIEYIAHEKNFVRLFSLATFYWNQTIGWNEMKVRVWGSVANGFSFPLSLRAE